MPNILTPRELVAELNAGGFPITYEQYRDFIKQLGTVTHQGTQDRGPEPDARGRMRVPFNVRAGKPRQVDKPYDEQEMARRKQLHASVLRHINETVRDNRWVDDPVPVPTPIETDHDEDEDAED